jgi:HD-GYP domain-containing protein (c-di-GMP phosphodiesterase class II)
VLHNTLQLQLELENARREAAQEEEARQAAIRKEHAETQKDAFETGIKQAAEATGKTGRAFLVILVVLSVICLIVFGVVIANLMVNLKSSKTQNERFMETLKVVSQLSNNIANKPSLTALPPLYEAASDVRMIGSGTAATGLPPEPVTEADKKEFADLAQACRDIGQKIDLATSRKNNSKNVAEICYKIAMEMGYGQYEASLFFSVGLVYDLGFLEIDSSLLSLKELTDQQKFEIRNHVKQGLAQLDFVPERYVSVFADGVLMHHENIDGSGYPEGLSGERIPYIARLLRVAESFVALISRRNYREITDKESAVADLRSKPAFYDQSIVDVLERLI